MKATPRSLRSIFASTVILGCAVTMATPVSRAVANDDDDLAKKAQNPIASMVSLPIDTSIDFGAENGIAVVSNIQPVIPARVGDWNLVSRFILPVAYVEGGVSGTAGLPPQPNTSVDPLKSAFGLGDLNYTGFLSPAEAGSVIWGVGPSITVPTATDPVLGAEKWSAGPSLVVLTQPKPWSLGILGRQLWSFEGASDRANVSQTMIQTFINYNLDNGWYLMTDPIFLANWSASSGNRWTVPVGAGIGRIFKIGNQPVNARLRAYYNVERPKGAPEWSVNFSLAFLFPK